MHKRFALLGMVASLLGCLGGSDGVENPKLELQFQPEGGPSALSGRVSLYGKGMNPVEDSLPLLSKGFAAGSKVAFSVEEMDSVIGLSLARQGRDTAGFKDTTVSFNLVASGEGHEAFLGGFSYRRQGDKVGFARLEGASGAAYGNYSAAFKLPKAVKGFSGRMGLYGIKLGIDYIFIPGSPYHANVRPDSSFTIGQMSAGSYGIIGADRDSSQLFESSDSLNTADSSYSAKAWKTILLVPDH